MFLGSNLIISDNVKATSYHIYIKVYYIEALDTVDIGTEADLYYKITVNGQTKVSQTWQNQDYVYVDKTWSWTVSSTTVDIEIELWDEDVYSDDHLDIVTSWIEDYDGNYHHTWHAGDNPVTITTQGDGNIFGGSADRGKIKFKIWDDYNKPPTCSLSANPTEGYHPLEVTFYMSASDQDGYISSWSLDVNNDGISEYSGSGNPPAALNHTYQNIGNYTAKLKVVDNKGATATDTVKISVMNIPPIADFYYIPSNPTDLCTIYFYDNSTDIDGDIVNWTWNFGDGNISYEQNPHHKYADDGEYIVALTVRDELGAENTTYKKINVQNVLPVVNFNYSPEIPNEGEVVNFSDLSYDSDGYIISRLWSFGDGSTSNEKNPQHVFKKGGVYTVILAVTDNDNATNTTTKQIIVNSIPSASFIYTPTNPKTGETVVFNASASVDIDGNIIKYEWDWNSDGIYDDASNTPIITHSWADDGIYNVTLRVTDNRGVANITKKSITITNRPPSASFSFTPSNPKPNQLITFHSTSYDPDGQILYYSWSFGDGTTSTSANPTHVYSSSGNYIVSLTVQDDDGASSTTSINIIVNVPPSANFTYSPANPTDTDEIQFKDLSYDTDGSITAWLWDFGDGHTSTKQNPTHWYTNDGIYNVTLTVKDDDGAISSKTIFVTIRNVKPIANFSYSPKSPKAGNELQFTDLSYDVDGYIINWTWNFGDGTIGYGKNITHVYKKAGKYNVTLTVKDDDGDIGKYSIYIEVKKKSIPGFNISLLLLSVLLIISSLKKKSRKKQDIKASLTHEQSK